MFIMAEDPAYYVAFVWVAIWPCLLFFVDVPGDL